jgi:ABC-type phosphate transport system substrate-binding protein
LRGFGLKPSIGIALLLIFSLGSASAEVVVIGNRSIKVDKLTLEDVGKLWLGEMKWLTTGERARVVDQKAGSKIRRAFYAQVANKSERQLRSYWAKRVFTGRGAPPRVLSDDDAVKLWVATTPGGLGYVDGGVVDDSVKVLFHLP